MINFTKMQGLGNDFIVIDNIEGDVCLSTEEIRQLSDRRFGIGFDQLLIVESSITKGVDFRYVIFNADGSEVNQCGNGARCFALYLQKKDLTNKNSITVETNSGNLVLTINQDNSVRVEMGEPNFIPSKIPFIIKSQALEYSLEGQKIGVLSIGNPHAVYFLQDIVDFPLASIGAKLQDSHWFPGGVNFGIAKVNSTSNIDLRVYERGAGETLACGSGACAAVVAGCHEGLLESNVEVNFKEGKLNINYNKHSGVLIACGETDYLDKLTLEI